jgi:L-malate glycosyltransferase
LTESRDSSPLRIVLVIGTLDRGGTEGQVAALAMRLQKRGHPVRIVCLDRAGPLGLGIRTAGVEVVEAGYRGISKRGYRGITKRSLRALFRVYRGIQDHHPDIVQCFLPLANILGVPLGRLSGARMVVISERSLQSSIRVRWLFRPLVWVARSWADAIVCNSHSVLEDLVRKARIARRKALVIRNGVDTFDLVSDTPPPPSDAPPPATVILAIANLIAYKGLDVLLEAFARVLERLGGHAVRLQLAGAGPEEGKLRAQAARLGIDGAVDFLGSVADVGPLLAECQFTVLPSYSEGMPNAVLESLAAGRAVIGTDVGGTAEILASGGGILVPPGDPGRLADAICGLIADPPRARTLGKQGREIVRDQFTMDQMVDTTLGLYTRLLAGRPDRRR